MTRFEYKVVPAPRRGEKARGLKGPEDRFALALTTLMNSFGREGWEYLRTDTLPLEERHGLAGRITTSYQNMLVFRRVLTEADTAPQPDAAPKAVVAAPPEAEPLSATAAAQLASVHPLPEPRPRGPRLVPPLGDPGTAPPLGPADSAGKPALERAAPTVSRGGEDTKTPPAE